jgi:hypothetical protein
VAVQEGSKNTPDGQDLFAEPLHVTVLRRAHLLRPEDRPVALRRIAIFVCIGWLPLAVLCLFRWALTHDVAAWSFFTDFGVYARFLVAGPVLILADYITLPRLESNVRHLMQSQLVAEEDRPRLKQLVASSRQLSAGVWPSAATILVVYVVIFLMAITVPRGTFPPWHRLDDFHLSVAGFWHIFISLPLLIGLILSWLWRLGLWIRFLLVVSHMSLQLISAHPDRAGGLQFLSHSPRSFIPLAFAIGAISAGTMADQVFHKGLSPIEHPAIPIATTIVVTLVLMFPPLIFGRALLQAWHHGMFTYGELARRMGAAFEAKWMAPDRVVDRSTLDLPDFSSTTDLYSIVAYAFDMQPFLFDYKIAVMIAIATLLPFAPIWLSVVPAKTLLDHLVGLLF